MIIRYAREQREVIRADEKIVKDKIEQGNA